MNDLQQNNSQSGFRTCGSEPLNEKELTVITKNIVYSEVENLAGMVADIINSLGENVSSKLRIIASTQLRQRLRAKQGLVKVSFENTDTKIPVLRNTHKLKDIEMYNRVFTEREIAYRDIT